MLNKIIHFSLQNRILVLVASVLLLIGGTYTARTIQKWTYFPISTHRR